MGESKGLLLPKKALWVPPPLILPPTPAMSKLQKAASSGVSRGQRGTAGLSGRANAAAGLRPEHRTPQGGLSSRSVFSVNQSAIYSLYPVPPWRELHLLLGLSKKRNGGWGLNSTATSPLRTLKRPHRPQNGNQRTAPFLEVQGNPGQGSPLCFISRGQSYGGKAAGPAESSGTVSARPSLWSCQQWPRSLLKPGPRPENTGRAPLQTSVTSPDSCFSQVHFRSPWPKAFSVATPLHPRGSPSLRILH